MMNITRTKLIAVRGGRIPSAIPLLIGHLILNGTTLPSPGRHSAPHESIDSARPSSASARHLQRKQHYVIPQRGLDSEPRHLRLGSTNNHTKK